MKKDGGLIRNWQIHHLILPDIEGFEEEFLFKVFMGCPKCSFEYLSSLSFKSKDRGTIFLINKKAFTIIEILIVLVILATMALLLIPQIL